MTYGSFIGYSEISNLNPQTEYFHKKVNFHFFKKCYLRVWCRKLSLNKIGLMDMSYIMDSGQNRLYTTFTNIFGLLSADLSKNQKNHFSKKNHDFWIKHVLWRGQIWFNRDSTLVPSPHQHSLQTHKFDFWVLEHKIFTYILLDYLQPNSQAKCK